MASPLQRALDEGTESGLEAVMAELLRVGANALRDELLRGALVLFYRGDKVVDRRLREQNAGEARNDSIQSSSPPQRDHWPA